MFQQWSWTNNRLKTKTRQSLEIHETTYQLDDKQNINFNRGLLSYN